jgi:opacity protein-like surface antigen
VRASSYTSGYKAGAPYSDLGLGVAARYRFVDALGLEVQWVYHDDTWSQGTQRIEQPLSASLQLFAMPWARVNPYLVAGVTVTQRNVQDKVGPTFVEENRAAVGPHIGLGLDFNLSEHSSLTLDGRYLAYANLDPNDAARAGALQGNLGLNFSF